MPSTINDILFGGGVMVQPSSADSIDRMQEVDAISQLNIEGSPEGSASANPGSICFDRLNGDIYKKKTGTGNTGWELIVSVFTDLHALKVIVGDLANGANYATIPDAIAATSAGDAIGLQQGTYDIGTINFTSSRRFIGIGSAEGTCLIRGKMTDSGIAMTLFFQNVQVQTDGDYIFDLSATNSQAVIYNGNYRVTDFTGSNIAAGATVALFYCGGAITDTDLTLWEGDGAGLMYYSQISNPGGSTTRSNLGGTQNYYYCILSVPIGSNGVGGVLLRDVTFDTADWNVTPVILSGSGASIIEDCNLYSGSASALYVDTSAICYASNVNIKSTNTNAINGPGTLFHTGINFFPEPSYSRKINVTTQTGGIMKGMAGVQGPSAGFVGEQIRATVLSVSPTSLSTGTYNPITSISLTPGIWDVSALVNFVAGASTNCTVYQVGVSGSNTAFTLGDDGDNLASLRSNAGVIGNGPSLSVPSYRVTVSATTTIYLGVQATFTVSTLTAFGRISASRVG